MPNTRSKALALAATATREDDPAILAAKSGLTEDRVRGLLPLLAARDASLDAEPQGTGSGLGERLAAKGPTPEEETAETEQNRQARALLDVVLAELSPREQLIIKERWSTDDVVTLGKLGTRLGVSKERVRQLEERARQKLKARLLEMGYEGRAA